MSVQHVSKRMICAINQLSIELTKGAITDPRNNFREGQGLGFVDRIVSNSVFGAPIYPTLFHQAAAYLFYIVKNHVFHDGNKRTGLAVAILFLEINGIAISPLDEDAVFDRIVGVAGGLQDADSVVEDLAGWLRTMALY